MTFEPFCLHGNYELIPDIAQDHNEIGSDLEKNMRRAIKLSACSKLKLSLQDSGSLKLTRTASEEAVVDGMRRQQVTYLIEPA